MYFLTKTKSVFENYFVVYENATLFQKSIENIFARRNFRVDKSSRIFFLILNFAKINFHKFAPWKDYAWINYPENCRKLSITVCLFFTVFGDLGLFLNCDLTVFNAFDMFLFMILSSVYTFFRHILWNLFSILNFMRKHFMKFEKILENYSPQIFLPLK